LQINGKNQDRKSGAERKKSGIRKKTAKQEKRPITKGSAYTVKNFQRNGGLLIRGNKPGGKGGTSSVRGSSSEYVWKKEENTTDGEKEGRPLSPRTRQHYGEKDRVCRRKTVRKGKGKRPSSDKKKIAATNLLPAWEERTRLGGGVWTETDDLRGEKEASPRDSYRGEAASPSSKWGGECPQFQQNPVKLQRGSRNELPRRVTELSRRKKKRSCRTK